MRALSLKAPYELELQKREIPTVGKGQALIRVLNTAICGSDLHAYRGRQAIFDYPRVMGHEVCGIVEALEGGSGNISPGDKVVLIPYANCKTCIACRKGKPGCCTSLKVMGVHTDGAMAEYCVVDEEYLIRVSQDMDSICACLVEPFAISTHAVHTAAVSYTHLDVYKRQARRSGAVSHAPGYPGPQGPPDSASGPDNPGPAG